MMRTGELGIKFTSYSPRSRTTRPRLEDENPLSLSGHEDRRERRRRPQRSELFEGHNRFPSSTLGDDLSDDNHEDNDARDPGGSALRRGLRISAPRARTVIKLAALSRLFIVTFAVLSFLIVGDYDKSAVLFLDRTSSRDGSPLSPRNLPVAPWAKSTAPCTLWASGTDRSPCRLSDTMVGTVRMVTRPLQRWDALYFRHIADEGYIWEQEFAFFPLLPAAARFGAETVLAPFAPILSLVDRVELAGIILTNACFVFATLVLYRLTMQVFVDERLAFLSALCFCVTPSGIIMSSMYTESPFALLTFLGHSLLLSGRYTEAAVVWCFGALTRANGVVYCGFFVWEFAFRRRNRRMRMAERVTAAMDAIPYILIVLAGFAGFQYFAWSKYCASRIRSLDRRPWCEERLPLIYEFVQKEYWNNGFLNYWTVKQAPNFLLAAFVMVFSAWGIWTYAAADWRRFLSAGISDPRLPDGGIGGWFASLADAMAAHFRPPLSASTMSAETAGSPSRAFATSRDVLPHVYLWAFLLSLNALFMHVQIAARFLSSLPVLYWFAASVLLREDGRTYGRAVLAAALLYAAAGVPLFAGFFPPA